MVINQSTNFGIDIMEGCASTALAASTVPGFFISVLGLRGRFRATDAAFLALLLVSTFVLNWARLCPMVFSRENCEYWHNGDGTAVVSLALGLMVIGIAWLAAHYHAQPRAAA